MASFVVPPPIGVVDRIAPDLLAFLLALARVPVGPGLAAESWYRDKERNIRVGGSPRSQHRIGTAVDVVGPRAQQLRFLEDARAVGLIGLDEKTHVHIQLFRAGVAAQKFPDLFV